MTKLESKETLRGYFKLKRSKLPSLIKKKIFFEVEKELQRLTHQDEIHGSVGIYWPLPGEVDLRPLRSSTDLKFALPSSYKNGQMKYHNWGNKKLEMDSFNIPSPLKETPLRGNSMGLILAPALAIDLNGIRLGYGGGFFDRLRSKMEWRSISSLAVLPKACVSHHALPKDRWDVPFNGWITEEGVTRIM